MLVCGVPQGSILGPFLFLLDVNDMPCLISQNSDLKQIENDLETNFNILCDWFIDNKLSIHLGEDKTKCILFTGKNRPKEDKLYINYKNITLKQCKTVKYLGCILDDRNSGEEMAIEIMKKINTKLKFLWSKHKFLNFDLRRLLCNAIIQPHFDYAVASWYTNISKGLSDKLQVCQNKCIRFCLHMDKRTHVGLNEFEKIKWLPVKERAAQIIISHVFKFKNNTSPQYMKEVFSQVEIDRGVLTRNKSFNLRQPVFTKQYGQRSLSYLGPHLWNRLPGYIKDIENINSFKHRIKDFYFDTFKKQDQDIT